ncbi:hypothetical protein KTC96_07030 [Clostridium estertheticum]|uniref:hypothetical protein n=1 Tax=Clostridium estertheticum TaxID=238834 RepID=UPI001C7DF2E9|nr:hypothetical protein [Clostridium estertheticum]MBX4261209.1 hypothetical protein [Clostridium estertheticum]WLC71750.1 hypothetical protein KTC96_07030 [Clostridium estertheticum]
MEKKKFNNLFIASLVIAALICYVSIILVKNLSEIYYLGIIISLVFAMLGLVARNKAIYYKKLQRIRENYNIGNKRERK